MTVKVGDKVMWRGAFGNDEPECATVTSLSITDEPNDKYGKEVSEVSWDLVENERVVFTLDNGHWAYSHQISKIERLPQTYTGQKKLLNEAFQKVWKAHCGRNGI